MDLELATTQELIDELLGRKTFVGFVAFSEDDHKFAGQTHKNFRTITNMNPEEVAVVAWELHEAVCKE